MLNGLERVVKILKYIIDVFGPDRDTNHVRSNAGFLLLPFAQLLMRRGGGVNDESFGVTNVCQQAGEFETIDHGLSGLGTPFDPEDDDASV